MALHTGPVGCRQHTARGLGRGESVVTVRSPIRWCRGLDAGRACSCGGQCGGQRLWQPARRVRSRCRRSWGRGVAPYTRPAVCWRQPPRTDACACATSRGGVRMVPGPVMALLRTPRSGRRRVVPACHRADAAPRLYGPEMRHAGVHPLGARAHDPPSVRKRPAAARVSRAT